MSQVELIIQVLKKHKLHISLSKAEQQKILSAKKRTFANILKQEKGASVFLNTFVNFYYWLGGRGFSLSLAKSIRVFNFASGALILFVCLSLVLTIRYQMSKGILPDERGYITFVVGKAWITRPGQEQQRARIKDILQKDDTLKTEANSSLMLHLGKDTIVKVQPNSKVKLSSLFHAGKTIFNLNTGLLLTKLKKLEKGRYHKIKTHNAVAAVRGTEFSVRYESGKTLIAVREGLVEVQRIDPGSGKILEKKRLSEGFTWEVKENLAIKRLSQIESLHIKKISIAPFIIDIENKTKIELEEIGRRQYLEELKIAKLINSLLTGKTEKKTFYLSLAQLRKKYNRIDTVILYTGKRYKGIILSRGTRYKILTPSGIVRISAKQIRRTFTK